MLKTLKHTTFLVSVAMLPLFLMGIAGAEERAVRVETLKTHSRLVVRIDESVPYEWKNEEKGFELLLKGIGINDLGVPLGEEEDFKSGFGGIKDPRIQSLSFAETPAGLRISGKWRFPGGRQAFATPRMETFDYREHNPPCFIADLWHKKGATVVETEAARKHARQLVELKRAQSEDQERTQRKLASVKEKKETEDLERYCREPLSPANDVFLKLRPFHEPVDFSRWISATNPDTDFHYYEPTTKGKEAQYVSLALDLYRQGKPALVLRTLDFFEAEHPRSEQIQEMRFLRANALVKLGLAKEAETILARLMAEAKDSPVALHSAMYVAAQRAGKQAWLASLDGFQWLIRNSPNHRLSWVFHLGAAEAYAGLKQTERAAKEYQWVIENAAEAKQKAEAASRLGDLYMERQQNEQGLASYAQALTYFGQEAASFPSVGLNRAEALYQIGQMDRAKDGFEEFLKKFPGHPAGWRAMLRLGETASRASEPVARTWYFETVNRHPFSPGATLARARLLPCGDHGGMNPEAAERFFSEEAEKFDGKGEVLMDGYADFKGLARVRTLVAFGRETAAADVAVQELSSVRLGRSPEIRTALSKMLTVLFHRRITSLLAEGKKLEAVNFYQDRVAAIVKESAWGDPEYLLKLSQAASDIGFATVAEEISKSYASVSGKAAPASEKNFTEAKAQFVKDRKDPAVAAKIRGVLAQVGEESPFSYEREIMLGQLDEQEGRFKPALQHAIKAQLLKPAGGSRDVRMESWIASLEARAGDSRTALEMYRNLEKVADRAPASAETGAASTTEVLGLPSTPALEALILTQAEILETEKRWGEAASTYQRAMDAGVGGARAEYGFARALLKGGDREAKKKALQVLEKIAANDKETNSNWVRLAKETLANTRKK